MSSEFKGDSLPRLMSESLDEPFSFQLVRTFCSNNRKVYPHAWLHSLGTTPVHSLCGMGLKMHAVHSLQLRVSFSCVGSAVNSRTHLFSVWTEKTWVLCSTAKRGMITLYFSCAKRAKWGNWLHECHWACGYAFTSSLLTKQLPVYWLAHSSTYAVRRLSSWKWRYLSRFFFFSPFRFLFFPFSCEKNVSSGDDFAQSLTFSPNMPAFSSHFVLSMILSCR